LVLGVVEEVLQVGAVAGQRGAGGAVAGQLVAGHPHARYLAGRVAREPGLPAQRAQLAAAREQRLLEARGHGLGFDVLEVVAAAHVALGRRGKHLVVELAQHPVPRVAGQGQKGFVRIHDGPLAVGQQIHLSQLVEQRSQRRRHGPS
jgi:hypothetical protein